MTGESRPLLDPPTEPAWLRDLTIGRLEVPDNHTEMRRLYRLLDRVCRSEAISALAYSNLTRSDGRSSVHLALDAQAQLIRGRFTYVGRTGRLHEHDLTRVWLVPDGTIWVYEACPALGGRLLEAANLALQYWLVAVMGRELYDLLCACFQYGQAVATLAHHVDPNIPSTLKRLEVLDAESEARRRGAELAALFFTERASLRRSVATSIASSWEGTLAELLATTDGILTPPADE